MASLPPKALLKAGRIRLDSETTLAGIPAEAWDYKLGNRSALEWILDQYKEKTPKDPTIREKFNTYRFADYKEKVVDLLARVTRVSVETQSHHRGNAQDAALTSKQRPSLRCFQRERAKVRGSCSKRSPRGETVCTKRNASTREASGRRFDLRRG